MNTLISMNASIPEAEPEPPPESAKRFTYASGSRPLAGYTIKRGVGRGGFGEVYFAVSDAGKEVALKLIRRNLDVELRGVTHCLNLKHPNLVALYDIRSDDHDDRWVVMEYVSGTSLDQLIDEHPEGMPTDLLLHWLHGMIAGVGYLHDHGIVHRDMKPANIFIDDETVKIGDYGLSKFISCSRRSGQTESVGTVHYMAPEIANGRYGREIDIYALGIILYEMLTGHVPFEGESVGEVLMKHLTAEPDLSQLSEPYQTIVRRAMAKDPDNRVKNVGEIIELLPPAPGLGPAFGMAGGGSANMAAGGWSDEVRIEIDHEAEGASPAAAAVGEEPLLASLRDAWRHAEGRFRNSPMHPFYKGLLGLAILSGLFVSSEIWFPLMFVAIIFYLFYRIVRAVVVGPNAQVPATGRGSRQVADIPPIRPAVAEKSVPNDAAAGAAQAKQQRDKRGLGKRKEYRPWRRQRRSWRRQVNLQMASKSTRDRIGELCGSMLLAAVVATVLSFLAGSVLCARWDCQLTLWLAIVGTLGSWAVMIPAKMAEGRVEDQAPMRFIQLIVGALVGTVAWFLADLLILSMPVFQDFSTLPRDSIFSHTFSRLGQDQHAMYSAGITHLPMGVFVAYFAFLFVLLKWWRQAEFARTVRVNLLAIAWFGLIAWGLHFFWWFPQPVGLLLAVIMVFTIQLTSPWLSASKRQALIDAGE
jgi:eukaryotic-like serine/threonine-protein kinase